MFGRQLHLFTVFGFAVKIDWSWLIIAVLITWSLAVGLFPSYFPGLALAEYWAMGVAGAAGLFASIVLHELSHSLVAREHGLEMRGITLFIFGGVAEMTDEPPSPRAEFQVAVAGPIASVVIAGVCYGLGRLAELSHWPVPVTGVLDYLAWINIVLAIFNLLPAFPLDGGRVLRSILWRARNNLQWATRVTSRIGAGFGVMLIVLGLLSVLWGNFIGGMWWFLIGLFLRNAAHASYEQLLVRRALEGEPVERFMNADVQIVEPNITLRQFVEDHVYRYHHKMFPVVSDGRLVGCVSTEQIRDIPREQWDVRTVGDVISSCSEMNTIGPKTDAVKALAKMSEQGVSRLMVVEDSHLRGIVSLRDLMRLISIRMELEGDRAEPG